MQDEVKTQSGYFRAALDVKNLHMCSLKESVRDQLVDHKGYYSKVPTEVGSWKI